MKQAPTPQRAATMLAFWIALAAVTLLSLLPATFPLPSTGWDKANHAFAYLALGLLGIRSWPSRPGRLLLFLVAYGIFIEVAQSFTETRWSDWRDLLANATGLVLAYLVARCRRW